VPYPKSSKKKTPTVPQLKKFYQSDGFHGESNWGVFIAKGKAETKASSEGSTPLKRGGKKGLPSLARET